MANFPSMKSVGTKTDLEWFQAARVCEILRLSRGQVYKLIDGGFLPAAKTGGKYLFLRQDTDKLIVSGVLPYYRRDSRFVSAEQAAKMLGVHPSTVYSRLRDGTLPHMKRGRWKLVPVAAVKSMIGKISPRPKRRKVAKPLNVPKSDPSPTTKKIETPAAPVKRRARSSRLMRPENRVLGSELVWAYLDASGMNSVELAKLVGCHRRDINCTKYGSGKVSRPMQGKIARYFRLKVEDMFEDGLSYTRKK